jgi:hypothetical protein
MHKEPLVRFQNQDGNLFAAYREAAGLVNHKESGKPLWVHHYDCSQEPQFRLLECNCEQLYGKPGCVLPPISQNTVPAQIPVMSASAYEVAQTASLSYPLISAPYGTEANRNSIFTGPSSFSPHPGPSYYPYPTTQTQQPTPQQVYARNAYGLPVNVSTGAVQTEQRSIHIANLPFSVGEEELRCLIDRKVHVTPETVYLHMDHSTGKSKGSGVASFSGASRQERSFHWCNPHSDYCGLFCRILCLESGRRRPGRLLSALGLVKMEAHQISITLSLLISYSCDLEI